MVRKFVLFGFALFAVAGFLFAAAGMLDGKTFEGMGAEKGKEATDKDKDTLIFADGKFRSTGCDQFGFTPAAYTATKNGDAIDFESTATSEKEGSIHWKGTVKGDAVEGTYVWTKPGQKEIEYWFKGTAKK